jgi:hypothetical protein
MNANVDPKDSSNQCVVEQAGTEATSELTDALTDLLTGISVPDPVKKSASKAFQQLCTAAIDVPVAYLESRAAEIRAESVARRNLIATTGSQIASKVFVEAKMGQLATAKFGAKILREQANLDRIAVIAAEQLKTETKLPLNSSNNEPIREEISDDWLNSFQAEASEKSSDEMQLLFGRILAGEIAQPSSFSIRTIKLISQLDRKSAILFRRLCSLSISTSINGNFIDARVCALGNNAATNALNRFGLGFDQLNVLHEYGLIIADYNSYAQYGSSCVIDQKVALPFNFQNQLWCLHSAAPRQIDQELRISGVALTRSGRELFNIVDRETDEIYATFLRSYFESLGLEMIPETLQ